MTKQPNILFIMADDHAADAISAYGSRINQTPNLDRIAGRAPEWELFDLKKDPCEMHNVADDPAYATICRELTDQLHRLPAEYGDKPYVNKSMP